MELEHRMTSDIDGFKKCSKCFRYVILHIIPIGHFRAPQLMNDDYRGVIQFTSVYTILYNPFYSWRMEMLKINENPADSRQARPSWPAAAGGTSPGEHPTGASRGRVPGAPHAGRRPHAGAAADTGDATTGTHGTAGVPRPDGSIGVLFDFFQLSG